MLLGLQLAVVRVQKLFENFTVRVTLSLGINSLVCKTKSVTLLEFVRTSEISDKTKYNIQLSQQYNLVSQMTQIHLIVIQYNYSLIPISF